MQVEQMLTGQLQVNTYFLIKDDKCLLVDPGGNDDRIINFINKKHLELVGILLTHAHFDHFGACNKLNLYYDVPLYIHQNEVSLLYDASQNGSLLFTPSNQLKLNEKVKVIQLTEKDKAIVDFNFNIYHVPGHSPGSICIYFKEEKFVFTGDALFRRGIGRTDFPYGNEKQLINNIKSKIFKLPDDTVAYPGHGDETTIGEEKRSNPNIR
ncbi:MAG: hypothetical protein K0Q49_2202 [Haloplasmataceae bacterium]|jgi:glyoxylase-like metal-dependent hydrolase (beta-lactamase superfamily II)|nr:hypothetical protein [Haloplasmataceae bacterium]